MAIKKEKLIEILSNNLKELKLELYNKKASNFFYIKDFSDAINLYFMLLIYELAITDFNKATQLGYRLNINSDSYKNMLKNKKIPEWTIYQMLILLDTFNITFSEVKKNVLFILMKNNNYIEFKSGKGADN